METSKGEVMAAPFGRTEMRRNQHWQMFADVHPRWPRLYASPLRKFRTRFFSDEGCRLLL
jgi:hypothetical protein